MKGETLFKEILESLDVKDVYIEGFTPEQIFYQLEGVLGERFSELEEEVNAKYAKRGVCRNDEKSGDEKSSDDRSLDSGGDEKSSDESLDTVGESDIVDESDTVGGCASIDDDTVVDTTDTADTVDPADSTAEGAHDEYEEVSTDIDPEMWDESSSSTDLINLPADEVMKLLRKKSKR